MDFNDLTPRDLTQINLDSETYGSFLERENTEAFMDTELGRAQVAMIREEAKAQGCEEDPSPAQLRGMLFSMQATQENGGYDDVKIISDEEMKDEYSFYERRVDDVKELTQKVTDAVDDFNPTISLNTEDGLLKDVEPQRDLRAFDM